jgi:tRNA pseudouridine38-40 synthase
VDAYRIAYDGRPFRGFQRQPDVATVSDTVIDALGSLGVETDADGVPHGYAAAGRTDAGVSALAQTVAFEAPEWLSPAALNSALPASVRAWASAAAPEGFHATHDATERTYTYYRHAPEATLDRGRTAAAALSGEHDFHNLTPDETGTVRNLSVAVEREAPFLIVTVSAGGFARQLVRRLVTVLDGVATGRADTDWIDRVLGSETLSGPEGIAPASPYPLVLTDVAYPDLTFRRDADAADSARTVFADRAAEFAARARVAEHVAEGVTE